MNLIDFHTHAFPDTLAPKAIPALEKKGRVKANLDGTIAGLLASMNRAGIAKSVVCSIATRPEQFEPIFAWSAKIRSERIIPLPSLHPADPGALEQVGRIRAAGFKGIKLHPYYQDFFLDEERLFPLYERIQGEGLLLVLHTGYDIGFPWDRRADPSRIVTIVERFPELKLVATHLGAWKLWDEVRELLCNRPLYMDISFALHFLQPEAAREIILNHGPERLLFGSDSPWADQLEAIKQLQRLELGDELEARILRGNALALLGEEGELP